MKLLSPDSSSDLDKARAAAQRLHALAPVVVPLPPELEAYVRLRPASDDTGAFAAAAAPAPRPAVGPSPATRAVPAPTPATAPATVPSPAPPRPPAPLAPVVEEPRRRPEPVRLEESDEDALGGPYADFELEPAPLPVLAESPRPPEPIRPPAPAPPIPPPAVAPLWPAPSEPAPLMPPPVPVAPPLVPPQTSLPPILFPPPLPEEDEPAIELEASFDDDTSVGGASFGTEREFGDTAAYRYEHEREFDPEAFDLQSTLPPGIRAADPELSIDEAHDLTPAPDAAPYPETEAYPDVEPPELEVEMEDTDLEAAVRDAVAATEGEETYAVAATEDEGAYAEVPVEVVEAIPEEVVREEITAEVTLEPEAVPPPLPEPPPPPPPPPLPAEPASWDVFIEDGMFLSRSRAGLIMDLEGAVVASRGDLSANAVQTVAARLLPALEQAGPDASFAALKLGRFFATAIRLPRGQYVAGFVGEEPIRAEVVPALQREFESW